MSSLLPWLLVGDKAMAKDRTELRKRKVKYILNVTPPMTEGGVANFFQNEGSLEYLRLPLRDVASDTIIPHIGAAVEFLQRARVRADGRVLVHCNEGKSRSAAIAAAFLIKAYNKTPDEALEALRFARPQAEPREAFVKQLRTLEPAILHSEVDGFEDSAAATAATAAASSAAATTAAAAPLQAELHHLARHRARQHDRHCDNRRVRVRAGPLAGLLLAHLDTLQVAAARHLTQHDRPQQPAVLREG